MNGEKRLAEAYCIKVHRSLGDKAIRTLVKLNLLNKDLRVINLGEHLLVPLKEKLSEEQSAIIRKEIGEFEILISNFLRREKQFKSLIDFLEDKLPPHLLASLPRSIDFIGDVAILEIPAELEDHKHLIGEAVLKVFKRAKSVLAKSSAVKGDYRIREYELIAGSADTETVHKEHGCRYFLDPRKVYFSPRLSYEHYRVASQVSEGETVIDMFAGVGPFSILIAKNREKVKVYSIDINPDAVEYLKRNIYVNNVYGKVIPFLGDVREIIEGNLRGVADRVIMDLPEKAIEYVDAACMALKPSGGIIHYYEIAGGADVMEGVKRRLIDAIEESGRIVETLLSERIVKEVAPYR
ncbi:MAG: class I SAM-dependent methyltransferase family protein, partial [Candidatus Bathyarchaeota archaeon]|nr:class I SAM-dependent methyltransferase family protein [Candidatus Bathyarchaeota archaeon]